MKTWPKQRARFAIARAKRTKVGRLICRLAGDERGAVAMEYVVIGVLVVAAAVAAVTFFGKQIVGSFGVMTQATAGVTGDAELQAEANQTNADTAQEQSEVSRRLIAPSERAQGD